MSKDAPPSYEQAQGINPTFPNTTQIGFQLPPAENPYFHGPDAQPYPGVGQPIPNAGPPYPGAGQPYPEAKQPYPGVGQPYPGVGQPYPGVGQPYPEVKQPYSGAGQPYPGVGQPYPNAGQPYPGVGQPYPGPEVYPENVQGASAPVQPPPITMVPFVVTDNLGSDPVSLFCPNCQENITTKVKIETGILAWVSCAALVLAGCWMGCCLIPFCMNGCNNVEHTCPRCKALIGKKNSLNCLN